MSERARMGWINCFVILYSLQIKRVVDDVLHWEPSIFWTIVIGYFWGYCGIAIGDWLLPPAKK